MRTASKMITSTPKNRKRKLKADLSDISLHSLDECLSNGESFQSTLSIHSVFNEESGNCEEELAAPSESQGIFFLFYFIYIIYILHLLDLMSNEMFIILFDLGYLMMFPVVFISPF